MQDREIIMTFEKLKGLIDKHNIPYDVHLQSDSGWECCETEMNGVYYNREENNIIFTQSSTESNPIGAGYDSKKGYIELK